MGRLRAKLVEFLSNRWLVFVAAVWLQCVAGVGYLFGSMSPVIKGNLGYNQRQIASLAVAKDLGDFVGIFAGSLSLVLPVWAALFIGALNNLIGYGWLWLIVSGHVPAVPLWAMFILIFIGTNGETYYNTAALVSCVHNFSDHRGPVIGILKGFSGLSGAILTQIYATIHAHDPAAIILMVAVGPAMIAIAMMFIIRPIRGHRQVWSSDYTSFKIIYSWCLLLAAYLMAVMLLEDTVDLSNNLIIFSTTMLLFLLLVPITIPLLLTFFVKTKSPGKEPLLLAPQGDKKVESGQSMKNSEAAGIKRILGKADFWLLFASLLVGTGTGLSVIDNLGQMSQSFGYEETHSFVSMISIWNFLGRIAGGAFSEIIVREYAYPRPLALAVAQAVMAIGHFLFAMAWPGTMYLGTLLVGLTYGAHWSIVPATVSELFGLKHFGALYNFIAMASPTGSLLFSVLITSNIYDYEAEKQAHVHHMGTSLSSKLLHGIALHMKKPLKCMGPMCFFLSSLIMSGFCIFAVVLSLILVYRTKIVYANL